MVCHQDMIMYLVSIKSFYRRIGTGRIIIVDDGTLTSSDRRTLSGHLGSPEIINIRDIDTGPFPKGGTWERLAKILDLLDTCYVIQIDSDTVTRNEVPEVLECVRSNRSFALGTVSRFGTKCVSLSEASEFARDFEDTHVQNAAEKNLAKLPLPGHRRYVRGSSGFAGFARGIRPKSLAQEFSEGMFALIGQKWSEWGSEQVMSNYLIANSPDPAVLPQPKYTCFAPGRPVIEASFLHFIGTSRYIGGIYARESSAAIKTML